MDTIGHRIKNRITQLGYPSVNQFAVQHGYQPQNVHEWVSGRMPRPKSLERLASDLKCPVTWLVMGNVVYTELGMLEMMRVELELLGGVSPASDKGEPVEERPPRLGEDEHEGTMMRHDLARMMLSSQVERRSRDHATAGV